MNPELVKKALAKVGDPHVLINMVSRRVRQLNSEGGSLSRPLILEVGQAGVADIAMLEIIEDKMGWEIPELVKLVRPVGRKRKRV